MEQKGPEKPRTTANTISLIERKEHLARLSSETVLFLTYAKSIIFLYYLNL